MSLLRGTGFFQLPRELIAPMWPELKPFVQSAIDRSNGMWDMNSVSEFMINFLWQAWVYIEDGVIVALVISRIEPFPSGIKVLMVETATGDHRERWENLVILRLEKFGRDEGCDLMRLVARPGWERALRVHGFEKTHVLLDKRL